ncbi:hypothetical protein DL766_006409 [Monosporascus sp. MC13-8B]|nr:hypothetical protein DL763_010438 [Monosporascus cannonballus]RYP27412.1 hypothetical protein DL766_006409 [Monosporascus sp. MC13-8B]
MTGSLRHFLDSDAVWLKILGAAFLILVARSVSQNVYNVFLHPLARIPGPRLMAASVLPMGRARTQGRAPYKLVELHERYGPVVRIGPNEVSCVGSAAFRDVYGSRAGKGGPMPRDHRAALSRRAFGAISLLQADVPTHAELRRRMNPAFSERAAREQEPLVARYVDSLVRRLRAECTAAADGAAAVDMCRYAAWATFDIQGHLLFGEDVFGSLERGRDHPWPTTTMGFFRALTWVKLVTELLPPRVLPAAQRLAAALGAGATLRRHAETAKRLVDRRMAAPEGWRPDGHPDYMSYIARGGAKNTGDTALTREEMYANAQVLLTAGSDTVATVLCGAVYHLLAHPGALARLAREVRAAFASDADIGFASVSEPGRLGYLQAVLSESMRLWPPVATPMARQVPRGGCEVAGYRVPEGALIGVNNYATTRSERNFRHAERFIPERWLGAPEYADDDWDAFQPFGYGPMSCLGSALGRLESRLLLAKLIWHFDLELMPESENWLDNMVNHMIWQKPPLMVKLRPVRNKAGS